MKRHTLYIIGIAACLSSCRTYGKYRSPTISTDTLYGECAALSDDTACIARTSWREFFKDRPLQALIDTGLSNNADLRIAGLRVAEAEAALKTARLAYLPSLSFTPQGQLSSYDGSKASQAYSLALSAEWELDAAGRLTAAKRGALATAEMYRAARQAVKTQLVATIANSYYHLLTLDAQLDVSRRSLKSWEEMVRTLKARKRVGEANEAAVSQAEANMLTVENNISTLQQQVNEQENALSVLIGQTPRPIERTTLAEQRFPEQLGIGIPLQMLECRPDIRQTEHALQAAFYNTSAARAAFYPQVSLSGTLGWSNTDGSSIVNPGRWLANALGTLTQPLFNRGRNKANLKIALARQEEALTNFRQQLLKAGTEVNNALTQWQRSNERVERCRQQTAALQKTVRSTRMLMQHSEEASYLEVLTAQQSLLQAELSEKQEQFNKIQGIINLYHALGGGE